MKQVIEQMLLFHNVGSSPVSLRGWGLGKVKIEHHAYSQSFMDTTGSWGTSFPKILASARIFTKWVACTEIGKIAS
jgi:hypothetical protein